MAGPPRPSRLRRVFCVLRRCTFCAVAAYLVAGFATARLLPDPALDAPSLAAIPLLSRPASPERPPDPEVVRGVLSVHTERSHDAEGTLREVVAAAERTGLDFVILGDHPGEWAAAHRQVMAPRTVGEVLVVPGLEMAVEGVGRTLIVGLDTLPVRWEGDVESLAERVSEVDGFLSVVHPRSPRARESWDGLAAGAHAWESLDVSEMARIRSGDKWVGYHLFSLLTGLVTGQGHRSLASLWREGTTTPAILAYDSARTAGPLTLTGGLNHHPKTRILGRLFPAYEPFFRTVVNHVLVPGGLDADPSVARGQIVRGLREGRLYVTLGDAEGTAGFRFEGGGARGAAVPMGGRAPWTSQSRLRIHTPEGRDGDLLVRVLRDGREVAWLEADRGAEFRWAVPGPGVYRVEIFKGGLRMAGLRAGLRPWILSNPVEFYTVASRTLAEDP